MTEPDRVAILAVVSSEEQAGPDLPSLDDQVTGGLRHCEQAGDVVVEVIRIPGHTRFVDDLETMRKSCPEYARFLDLIDQRQVTKTVAYKFDRYARTTALASQLFALTDKRGVWLYSIREPTSRETDMVTRWVRMVYSLTAEQYVRELIEKRRQGMQGRVKRGKCIAVTRPYGYLLILHGRERHYLPYPDEVHWVQWLMERRAEGWGYWRTIRELERRKVPPPKTRWSPKTLNYIWRNPIYAGYVRYVDWRNWDRTRSKAPPTIIAKGTHEPIISEDLWQRVERINELAVRDYAGEAEPRLLSGLCQCAFCGGGMSYRRQPGGQFSISCGRYRRQGGRRSPERPDSCPQHNSRSVRILRRYVLATLREILHDPEAWARACEAPDARLDRERQIDRLKRELAGVEQRRRNLLDAIETAAAVEDRRDFVSRYDALSQRRAAIQAEIVGLQAATERIDRTKARLYEWSEAADQLETWDDARLRPILLQVIDRIILEHGKPPVIVIAGQS